jgi:hypothetical protein
MQVAVITPYFRETRAQLERCISSVAQQSFPTTHLLVADGEPQGWIDEVCEADSQRAGAVPDGRPRLRHIRLDRTHADYGNTPRAIGSILCASEGFGALCFLDADNWLDPGHVQCCLDAGCGAELPVDYVVARRRLVRADGSVIPLVTEDDARVEHVDTNCFFLFPGAFHSLGRWGVMPKPLASVGDRIYLASLRQAGLRFVLTDHPTVNYLCTWSSVFEAIGEEPPDYAKPNIDVSPMHRWWKGLPERERVVANRLAGVAIAWS